MEENGCEMGEGVMGIYRDKKQQTSNPKGIRPHTIFTSGPIAHLYVQVLSSGRSKN